MSMKQEATNQNEEKHSFFDSWTFIIIICIALPILFRSLVYAPFHIPSGSMKSTLLIGDFIFVSKFSYGYSRYSFPLGYKFFEGRVWNDLPQRGDVAVFRPTRTPRIDYIKRIVGLPGDTIRMKKGRLFINDVEVERRQVEDFVEIQPNGDTKRFRRYIETLPNGVSYMTLDEHYGDRLDNTDVFEVPKGHYFLMGDNRDNSADSRTDVVGFVPYENLVGRAEVIAFSSKSPIWQFWRWFTDLREGRFFKSIELENV